ncbi:MAG: chromosomal replication initiator protein DnaA [Thermoflexales bacterium]|nr:chromosomal replication initiator protein DnaA [Thermoflexales bacterium]
MRPYEAWESVLGELELSMERGSFLTWLRSARLLAYEDGQFIVAVPNGYAKQWIEQRKLAEIRRMLSARMGRTVDVKLVVMASNATAAHTQTPSPLIPSGQAAASSVASDGLLPRYTFEAFVVGPGNQVAYAAARSVADRPGQSYNPLFLYGGSGLGKTHLLHAIGNFVKQRGLVCRYVNSETFSNELIAAIRTQSQEAFRSKYRLVDVLLLDDVQFIAGKEFIQEELFHTFNTLHSANKQIVLTSDRAPRMMVTLEERLRSRFEWGLMADISPPDLETRMAILQHKAAQMGRELPMEVVEFVARQVQSNVRELEGALTRLLATAEITGRPISVQLARDALSDLTGRRVDITPSQVIEAVAAYYNISVAEMVSPSRNKELVQPRQVAMYLLRQETDASLPEIGALLGGRDHTTVLHGVDRIRARLEVEEQLRRDIMHIRERLYLRAS